MAAALGWGALAASSLVIGGLLGLARQWPSKAVGLVLAFGAGALISAVSFDLAEEGIDIGGGDSVGLGLALGALTYFTADRLVERMGRPKRHGAEDGGAAPAGGDAGTGLALGSIAPAQIRRVWVRRTAANSSPVDADGVTFGVSGDTAA